jgi:hypothetical protein
LQETAAAVAEDGRELIDASEIFDHIRDITDPEHPYSLEQLNVVEEELISVDDGGSHVKCVWLAAMYGRGADSKPHLQRTLQQPQQ